MTQVETISAPLKRFINDSIDSVETLDVLIFLTELTERGERGEDEEWSVSMISEELRSSPVSVKARLEVLVQRGLVSRVVKSGEERFVYRPRSPEIAELVRDLRSVYKERKYGIIELIFSKPIDALQSFANAFKIKGDK